jgi:hypothetical protein
VECIEAVHHELVAVTATAPDELRKAVAQAFVHEVRVEREDLVLPTYRLLPGLPDFATGDDAVRTMTGSVVPTGRHKNRGAGVPVEPVSLRAGARR